MKKIVLFAAVVFGLSTMNAQKNSILLGGNVGYNHSETKIAGDKSKTDKIEVNPYLGYQFSDNFTVGAKFGYSHSKFADDNKFDEMKLGGFVRYTQPFSETFAIYADLEGGWMHDVLKTKTPDVANNNKTKFKGNGFYIGFTPALFINFKNDFGLNFSIGGVEYSHMKHGCRKDDGVKVTFGNAFNVGISKNFKL